MKSLALKNYAQYDTLTSTPTIALNSVHTNITANKELNANLLSDFFAFLDVSEKTAATYQRALKQLFKYFTAHGITHPAYDDIVDFKKSLENAGRKSSTIALYLAAARKFFTWTEQRGIYQNVATGIKTPKQDKGHKRDFLGATQLKEILSDMGHKTPQEKRDYAIFFLMAACGLRTIEVSRANVEDMRILGDSTVLYVQGKGRNDRTEFVKLPALVLQAINDYLSSRGQVSGNSPLFASTSNRNQNGRMTTRSISGIAKSAMRNAGYNSSRLTAHSLRHSAVTLSLFGGMSLQETQGFARHSNVDTTLIYAHTVDRLRSMCEDTIVRLIFGE